MNTSSVSDHAHGVGNYEITWGGSHSHNYTDCRATGEQDANGLWYAADNEWECPTKSTTTAGYHNHDLRGWSGYAGGHTNYITGSTATAGTHNHSFSGTTTMAGGSDAIDIRPKYYALAYIMKLPPPE